MYSAFIKTLYNHRHTKKKIKHYKKHTVHDRSTKSKKLAGNLIM